MRLLAYTMTAGLFALPAFANCYSDAEADAARVRVMQTDFMVAALSCDRHGVPEVRQRYTNLVQKFTPEFAQHGRALIGYFQRAGGGGRALDSFITNLANEMALSANSTPNYCQSILAKMDKALTSKVTLAALAPQVGYSSSPGPGNCGNNRAIANAPNKSAPAAAPAAAPAPVAKQAAPATIPAPAPLGGPAPAPAKQAAGPNSKVVTNAATPAPATVDAKPQEKDDAPHPDANRDIGANPDASRTGGFAP